MVRGHRLVVQPEQAWANGALFAHQRTELLARAEDSGDKITLRARGPESKALLSVIAGALDDLNSSFRGLEGKVGKWVPCHCSECKGSTNPQLFEERRLLQRKERNMPTIECHESGEKVSVLQLLDGLELAQSPAWAKPPEPLAERTIRIFLASSEELAKDRDEFDLYFRQKNDVLRSQGLYLEITRWENFLDAMSSTRLQDEYNAAIRNSDIFVCLFKTKTGKFTDEEFDAAHRAFLMTGKPRIFTFFKDAQLPVSAESLRGLESIVRFQEKLGRLGHYWTKYESAEHLKRLFKDQLEKLENRVARRPEPPTQEWQVGVR
jgi:hypothetical protein